MMKMMKLMNTMEKLKEDLRKKDEELQSLSLKHKELEQAHHMLGDQYKKLSIELSCVTNSLARVEAASIETCDDLAAMKISSGRSSCSKIKLPT